MLKNIIYIAGSVLVFFAGLILYGTLLNVSSESLLEEMRDKGISKLENVSLVIERDKFELNLYSDSLLVKTYKVVFGRNPSTVKTSKTDLVTPVGRYKICSKKSGGVYYKELKLNFPNEKDAANAVRMGIISKTEFKEILAALKKDNCSFGGTVLGSNISIHGMGKFDFIFSNLPFAFNWTNGSIAMSNESIDEIYSVVKLGTPVIIRK